MKRSYDGIVANGSDAPLYERLHLWLDLTKLGTLSRTAEKHVQVNMDCTLALVLD